MRSFRHYAIEDKEQIYFIQVTTSCFRIALRFWRAYLGLINFDKLFENELQRWDVATRVKTSYLHFPMHAIVWKMVDTEKRPMRTAP